MTISTRRTCGPRDSWQRNARAIARGLLGWRDLPDRKTKQQQKEKEEEKTLACVSLTPNDPPDNSRVTMRWQSVAWKKRFGPLFPNTKVTCCVAGQNVWAQSAGYFV